MRYVNKAKWILGEKGQVSQHLFELLDSLLNFLSSNGNVQVLGTDLFL